MLRSVVDYSNNLDVEVVSESYRIVDDFTLFRIWLSNVDDLRGLG